MDAHVPDRSNRRFAFRMPRMSRGRVLGVAACALGGAIAVNATLFQSERHPAPMFRTLARPQVAKAEVPPPPMLRELREANEKNQSRGEKAAALAAPAADPVVRDIQTELAARGYYKGEPDGKTGPATTKAIRDFQVDRRMSVDGMPSEGLLAEVRSARENMKEELFDLVKRAHAPERGDKPVLRKAEPLPQAKPSPAASVPKVAAKADAKPKTEIKGKPDVKAKPEGKAKTEASHKTVAKADSTKIHATEKKKTEAQVPQQAKARTADPAKVARKEPAEKAQPQREAEKTRAKVLAKTEPAPKSAARPRLEADAPLRPPANVAEIIARN